MLNKEKLITLLQRIKKWLRYWLWRRPVSKPEPLKATEVIDNWVIIDFHGQKINLHKNELKIWFASKRKDKRAMALRFKIMEKKGQIKFVEINGKLTCVYNRDYDKRAEKKKAEEHGL